MSTYQPLVPVNRYLTWQKELYRCNKLKDLGMFRPQFKHLLSRTILRNGQPFQFQSEGNVSEEEWSEEVLLLKKKDPSQGMRPHRNQERLGKGSSRKNAALWTLGCWPTETLFRLLAHRTEQSKSVLSLHHPQDLQTVLPQGTGERALLSCGNCQKRLCQETLLRQKDHNLSCCRRK